MVPAGDGAFRLTKGDEGPGRELDSVRHRSGERLLTGHVHSLGVAREQPPQAQRRVQGRGAGRRGGWVPGRVPAGAGVKGAHDVAVAGKFGRGGDAERLVVGRDGDGVKGRLK